MHDNCPAILSVLDAKKLRDKLATINRLRSACALEQFLCKHGRKPLDTEMIGDQLAGKLRQDADFIQFFQADCAYNGGFTVTCWKSQKKCDDCPSKVNESQVRDWQKIGKVLKG